MLVLDTETTVDPTQRLLFGSARYYRVTWDRGVPTAKCAVEYLIHADDLDPKDLAKLERHARHRLAATDPGVQDRAWNIQFRSRRDFVEQVLRYVRASRVMVAGYNLPFDLSRLALWWRVADNRRWRKLDPFDGGFSLVLSNLKSRPDEENYRRSRVEVKTVDSKRHLMRLTNPGDKLGRGQLLDLHTLAFALSDRNYTLEAACPAFGVRDGKGITPRHGVITHRYIEYNRRDVAATAALWERAMEQFRLHPIQLQANAAFSAASIGKAYLRAMGITPPRKRLGEHPAGMTWYRVLGAGMVAYYGGRAECRIRKVRVPVVPVDFTAMYPTVAILTGTWELLRSERIGAVEESPGELRDWIEGLELSHCFDPKTWARLNALVQIIPDEDILPVRARYSGSEGPWGIGVNPFTCSEPMWYPLADLVASRLLTGRTPEIRRVVRIAPQGLVSGLSPVDLLGRTPFDPTDLGANLFRSLVEERGRPLEPGLTKEEKDRLNRFPKTLVNATCYGILAEMARHELLGRDLMESDVHGLRSFRVRTHSPEDPGEFSFPPVAAITTGGARLMLAMLERLVTGPTGRAGAYAFCDTDSMAIVASPRGGLVDCPGGPYRGGGGKDRVPVLSWGQVDQIRSRFETLNPYSRLAVPHLLKLTDEDFADPATRWGQRQVFCYAVSTKRYALLAKKSRGGGLTLIRSPDFEDEGEREEADEAALDLVDAKEHGLAQLLNPIDPESSDRDWIRQAWEWTLGPEAPRGGPGWLDRPAVSRISVSSPGLMDSFAGYNGKRPYAASVKPFNFMLVAYVHGRGGYPFGVDATRFVLVAPYTKDSRRWHRMDWYNRWDPNHTKYRITTVGETGGHDLARVKTYRDVLTDYFDHAETKSSGTIGGNQLPGRGMGLLGRRRTRAVRGLVQHIGKESNDLEGRIHRIVTEEAAYLNRYSDEESDPFKLLVMPVLQEYVATETRRGAARIAGVPSSTLADVLSGATADPRLGLRRALTAAAAEYARGQLKERRLDPYRSDDILACAAFLL